MLPILTKKTTKTSKFKIENNHLNFIYNVIRLLKIHFPQTKNNYSCYSRLQLHNDFLYLTRAITFYFERITTFNKWKRVILSRIKYTRVLYHSLSIFFLQIIHLLNNQSFLLVMYLSICDVVYFDHWTLIKFIKKATWF